jgi:beta-glucosidase
MPWLESVPAVLEAWYPGEEDGNVVADIVFGRVNPSGKLPMTFPRTATEVPASTPEQYPGVNGTATYSEKLLVGYRWYDAKNVEPLFPFGFGLSYTTFSLANLAVSQPGPTNPAESLAKSARTEAKPIKFALSVEVKNTGHLEGADVVQVYIAAPPEAGEPPRQLKGFAKVALKPGETKRVSIDLDARAYSLWDVASKQWIVAPGTYHISVGDSSRNLTLKRDTSVSVMR